MPRKNMDHSDVADTGADNSVTSRMEWCIITNLEFNIGKRKRRTAHKWQALPTREFIWRFMETCKGEQ